MCNADIVEEIGNDKCFKESIKEPPFRSYSVEIELGQKPMNLCFASSMHQVGNRMAGDEQGRGRGFRRMQSLQGVLEQEMISKSFS